MVAIVLWEQRTWLLVLWWRVILLSKRMCLNLFCKDLFLGYIDVSLKSLSSYNMGALASLCLHPSSVIEWEGICKTRIKEHYEWSKSCTYSCMDALRNLDNKQNLSWIPVLLNNWHDECVRIIPAGLWRHSCATQTRFHPTVISV